MSVTLCIIEDSQSQQLDPLTAVRPVYDLQIGASSLLDKLHHCFPNTKIVLHGRKGSRHLAGQRYNDPTLDSPSQLQTPVCFVNGRLLLTEKTLQHLEKAITSATNQLGIANGDWVMAYCHDSAPEILNYLQEGDFKEIRTAFNRHSNGTSTDSPDRDPIQEINMDAILLKNSWDIIHHIETVLTADITLMNQLKKNNKPKSETGFENILTYQPENITLCPGATLEAFSVLDARKGPIYIDEGAVIQSGSRLEGPIYIGKKAQVLGARMGCSAIGAHCKIGGEVSHTIVSAYSNKAHEGFIGHSFIGEWVNLGALTTTSNLKSTYGSISIEWNSNRIDTGEQFLGTLMADHVKTAIHTALDTGTIIGYGAQLFGAAHYPKEIASFSWGIGKSIHWDSFLKTAERMMQRRQVTPSEWFCKTVQVVYQNQQSKVTP